MTAPITWQTYQTLPHGFTIYEAHYEGLDARIYHAKTEAGEEAYQIKLSPSFPPGPHVTEAFTRPELAGAKKRAEELLRATAEAWDPTQDQLDACKAEAKRLSRRIREELDGIRADQLETQASADYLEGHLKGPADIHAGTWEDELKTANEHTSYILGRAQGVEDYLGRLDELRKKIQALQAKKQEEEEGALYAARILAGREDENE